ncbi:glycosyltransferase family 4 protein [Methanofollis formosanus]|nr:glycosyltransferase family 4 protein [Methanofollis formosanus]
MKVLMVTDNVSGGIVHYVSQLANALADEDETVLFAPIGIERQNFSTKVRVEELPVGNTLRNFIVNTALFPRAVRFLAALQRERPEVIHFQLTPPWFLLFFPFLRKYPMVTTIHDVRPHTGSRAFDQVISNGAYINRSDAVIVHGQWAKEVLGAGEKCHVVPHGDYAFFGDCGENARCAEETGTVLFFGRIEDYKGLSYLLDAMSGVVRRVPDARLVIAGSGDLSPYQKAIDPAWCEVHNRYIKDDEVAGFFMRASVVVLPYIEGTQTGIVPIAYAFRKPVVVTAVGSIPEVVDDGETGRVVRARDVEALEEALSGLLIDPKRCTEMGEAGYRKMRAELSWEVVAERTREVYRSTIRRKNVSVES